MSITTQSATRILMAEHEVILKVLDCLEKLAETFPRNPDLRAAEDVLDFLRGFADRCHHGKEEGCLFPALVRMGLPRRSGPIAMMLAEHEVGRSEIAKMHAALVDCELRSGEDEPRLRFVEGARAYVHMLRRHIAKENGILFPMAEEMMDEHEGAAIVEAFGALEHDGMGAGTHERYLALAERLVRRLGVTPSELPLADGRCFGACSHG